MGLFTGLLLLPLAPIRATVWIAEKLTQYAESELADEQTVRRLAPDKPVYLILAMSPDRTLRMKPQDLITGLPIERLEAVS